MSEPVFIRPSGPTSISINGASRNMVYTISGGGGGGSNSTIQVFGGGMEAKLWKRFGPTNERPSYGDLRWSNYNSKIDYLYILAPANQIIFGMGGNQITSNGTTVFYNDNTWKTIN